MLMHLVVETNWDQSDVLFVRHYQPSAVSVANKHEAKTRYKAKAKICH